MSGFVEPEVRHQKSATHTKAHEFEHKMDFEYKMIIVMYHPNSFWVYKQMKFVLKLIIGCHPE